MSPFILLFIKETKSERELLCAITQYPNTQVESLISPTAPSQIILCASDPMIIPSIQHRCWIISTTATIYRVSRLRWNKKTIRCRTSYLLMRLGEAKEEKEKRMSVEWRVACCGRHTEEEGERDGPNKEKETNSFYWLHVIFRIYYTQQRNPSSQSYFGLYFFLLLFHHTIPTSSYHRHFLELFFLFLGHNACVSLYSGYSNLSSSP